MSLSLFWNSNKCNGFSLLFLSTWLSPSLLLAFLHPSSISEVYCNLCLLLLECRVYEKDVRTLEIPARPVCAVSEVRELRSDDSLYSAWRRHLGVNVCLRILNVQKGCLNQNTVFTTRKKVAWQRNKKMKQGPSTTNIWCMRLYITVQYITKYYSSTEVSVVTDLHWMGIWTVYLTLHYLMQQK